MVPILSVWNRLQDYAKKYQSGIDVVADFNGKINELQNELITTLLPFYESNDRVKNILDPFALIETQTTSTVGVNEKPDGFLKILRMTGIGEYDERYAIYPVEMNEIDVLRRIPQRMPSVELRQVYYYGRLNEFQFFPEEEINYEINYLIYPPAANIAFTFQSVDQEDVMTYDPANSEDLGWNMDAFNFIIYMMLDKYGISSRELLLNEFGKLGIQQEISKESA